MATDHVKARIQFLIITKRDYQAAIDMIDDELAVLNALLPIEDRPGLYRKASKTVTGAYEYLSVRA